jgi:uncharacterized protein GlcG (DUF336 family)
VWTPSITRIWQRDFNSGWYAGSDLEAVAGIRDGIERGYLRGYIVERRGRYSESYHDTQTPKIKLHVLPNMRFIIPSLLALLPLALGQINGTNGIGSTPQQRNYVSAHQAQQIIKSAITNATALNIPENIAVVDPSGLLVAFHRMDNAFPGSIELSQKKARTAVLFNGLASGDLYAAVQPGAPLYGVENSNGGLIVFGGGYPIYLSGKLIGGVGVSGGTVPQDIQVAQAGIMGIGANFTQPS